MSYNTIALMAHDGDLAQRFIACAAQEGIDAPTTWVNQNIWELVTDADAVQAYQYAIETDHDDLGNYGKNSSVINDAKILSIVQAHAPQE